MRVRKEQKEALAKKGGRVVMPCPRYEGRFALVHAGTEKPAAGVRYTVRRDGGPIVEGVTDAEGLTQAIKTKVAERCTIEIPVTFVVLDADGKETSREVEKVVVAGGVTGAAGGSGAGPGGAQLMAGAHFVQHQTLTPAKTLTKEQFDQLTTQQAELEYTKATRRYLQTRLPADRAYYDQVGQWLSHRNDARRAADLPSVQEARARTNAINLEALKNPGAVADELLRTSPSLSPWVSHLARWNVFKADWSTLVHASDKDFVVALIESDLEHAGLTGKETDAKSLAIIQEIHKGSKTVVGFVDPDGRVHLPPKFGGYFAPLHELVHIVCTKAFLELGTNVQEGATEYFARLVATDHGLLPRIFGAREKVGELTAYDEQQAAIAALVGVVGLAPVASAYFRGKVEDLQVEVEKKRGPGMFNTWRKAVNRGDYRGAEKILGVGAASTPAAGGGP
jgi:hypothetical protein